MTTWFTSDHHFGHENIIKYTDRPFNNVDEMDAEMIYRWNEKVDRGDLVYHLGDFTLDDKNAARDYIGRLNGSICFLHMSWHHDRRWIAGPRPPFWSKIGPVSFIEPLTVLLFAQYGNDKYPKPVMLCHYPLAEWDRKHYGAWHLHGHSHGKHEGDGLILDVGVDNHGFYPVSLEEIAEIMQNKGNND